LLEPVPSCSWQFMNAALGSNTLIKALPQQKS